MQNNTEQPLTSKYAKLAFLKSDDVAQSIVTKLITANNGQGRVASGGNRNVAPEAATLERISKTISNDIDDAANMMQINPDLGLAQEIMVSLIVAPKDMVSHDLTWSTGKCDLPSPLVGEMQEELHTYFTQDYKINDLLIPSCEDALFNTGSYPLVIIPESSVDNIINQNNRISLEDLSDKTIFETGHTKNRGILGCGDHLDDDGVYVSTPKQSRAFGLESLHGLSKVDTRSDIWFDKNVRVLDSVDNLKIPLLQERLTQEMLRDRMNYGNVSMEEIRRDVELERLEDALYVRRPTTHVPVITVDVTGNASRLPKGHPLVMKLPSESIIPVHIPGSPKDHVGYFVMIDEFGNPVTRAMSSDYYKQMTSRMNSQMDTQGSQASTILQNVKAFMGQNCAANKYDGIQLMTAYERMMETELLARIKRGIYGEAVELSSMAPQVYQVMLARSLANMRTSLLYIPIEQCTYIAFDYNNAGLGKSLLSDVKVLGALRSLLLLSDTMGSIRNSIPRRHVNVTLDESLPDPYKTVELVQGEYAKTMNNSFPLGVTNPRDQMDMLQNAGVYWNITGHPDYPTTSVDVEETNTTQIRIDTDLSDRIKNLQYMGLGMPPEIVDSSLNIEFAATVYSSNLLLAKRSAQKQKILTDFMVDFVRKYVLSDGVLLSKLTEIIERNKSMLAGFVRDGEQLRYSSVIKTFLDALKLELPSPDQMKTETQLANVQNYMALIDATLPLYVNVEVIRESLGEEFSDKADLVYNALRDQMILDWMNKNNIVPELRKLVEKGDEDNPGYDFLTNRLEHTSGIALSVAKYLKFLGERNGGGEAEENTNGGTSTFDDTSGGTGGGDTSGELDSAGDSIGAQTEIPQGDDPFASGENSQEDEEDPDKGMSQFEL